MFVRSAGTLVTAHFFCLPKCLVRNSMMSKHSLGSPVPELNTQCPRFLINSTSSNLNLSYTKATYIFYILKQLKSFIHSRNIFIPVNTPAIFILYKDYYFIYRT